MLIIPAIDLREGRCVRLLEGKKGSETVYADDPVSQARAFAALGAKRVHVVDLDGAFDGRPKNADVIGRIAAALTIPIEVGGGLRDRAAVDSVLGVGARFAMLGTALIENPALIAELTRAHPGRIIAAIDARDGVVATEGWVKSSGRAARDVAREAEAAGVAGIVYTDIARDGTGRGVNVEATDQLAAAVSIPVIASGGVGGIEDIRALAQTRVFGVIVGRALYEKRLDLAEAIAVAEGA